MIIKLQKVKDINHKGFNFKEIIGQKADGSEYSKRIIIGNNTTDILNQLSNFGAGDFINLSYDQSKFKNVNGIKAADGFPEQQQQKQQQQNGGFRKLDGTSRGDDTNRASAIYLAKDIIVINNTEANLRKMDGDSFIEYLMQTANKIYQYIANGTVIETKDALTPPDIED